MRIKKSESLEAVIHKMSNEFLLILYRSLPEPLSDLMEEDLIISVVKDELANRGVINDDDNVVPEEMFRNTRVWSRAIDVLTEEIDNRREQLAGLKAELHTIRKQRMKVVNGK